MGDDLGVLLLLLGKTWLPEALSSCQFPSGLPPLPKTALPLLPPLPPSAPHQPDLHWATSAQALGDKHPLPTCFS